MNQHRKRLSYRSRKMFHKPHKRFWRSSWFLGRKGQCRLSRILQLGAWRSLYGMHGRAVCVLSTFPSFIHPHCLRVERRPPTSAFIPAHCISGQDATGRWNFDQCVLSASLVVNLTTCIFRAENSPMSTCGTSANDCPFINTASRTSWGGWCF